MRADVFFTETLPPRTLPLEARYVEPTFDEPRRYESVHSGGARPSNIPRQSQPLPLTELNSNQRFELQGFFFFFAFITG